MLTRRPKIPKKYTYWWIIPLCVCLLLGLSLEINNLKNQINDLYMGRWLVTRCNAVERGGNWNVCWGKFACGHDLPLLLYNSTDYNFCEYPERLSYEYAVNIATLELQWPSDYSTYIIVCEFKFVSSLIFVFIEMSVFCISLASNL